MVIPQSTVTAFHVRLPRNRRELTITITGYTNFNPLTDLFMEIIWFDASVHMKNHHSYTILFLLILRLIRLREFWIENPFYL